MKYHLVLNTDNPIEHNGPMPSLHVIQAVHSSIQPQSTEQCKLRQRLGRASVWHLDIANIIEIHLGCSASRTTYKNWWSAPQLDVVLICDYAVGGENDEPSPDSDARRRKLGLEALPYRKLPSF